MNRINWKRVIAGGLLAGLIINIGEFLLNGVVLASEWATFRQQLGLDDSFAPEQIAVGVINTFLYGIVLIWLYAAIRPRFGPGPRTALIAGGALWVLAYVLFAATLWAGGMFSTRLMVVSIAWGAIEVPVAALTGAWIYREDSGDTGTPARAS